MVGGEGADGECGGVSGTVNLITENPPAFAALMSAPFRKGGKVFAQSQVMLERKLSAPFSKGGRATRSGERGDLR